MLKPRSRVAVIGGGISGLSSACILQSHGFETHLFESEARLGGHANAAFVGPERTPVDTGFIVFNELNYPHLTAFFKMLEVPVADSEMSLSVRFTQPNLEWGGTNLATMFAQARNLARPAFWAMVRDILRFHKEAEANLTAARDGQWSLRELLEKRGYGRSFADWYLIPMGAAIWSTPPAGMLDFPAATFLHFCLNHRLLQVNDRPVWKTVRGSSIEYVKRVHARLRHVHLGHPVERVVRHARGVELQCAGQTYEFDAVVFATHPPQTLKILAECSREEARVLGAFGYQPNVACLHSDVSVMPRRRGIWSSWNFHQETDARALAPVSLSYWMNRLQPLGVTQPLIVSLNSGKTLEHVHAKTVYEHPVFNQAAIDAQAELGTIQGRGGVYHCGAWTRFGFHEDGILSAARLANSWGLTLPWHADPARTAIHESERSLSA